MKWMDPLTITKNQNQMKDQNHVREKDQEHFMIKMQMTSMISIKIKKNKFEAPSKGKKSVIVR